MLETVSAEIIYCRERARLAREKADAATAAKDKNNYLASEARWLALARSYDLQDRLSKTLGEHDPTSLRRKEHRHAFQPEVVAVVTSAFHDVFAELADRDEIVGLRAARRIIELAARGERDPERLKAVVLAWLDEAHPIR
jgi:hypothetical protein